MITNERGLSEEQRMMRDGIRAFVDEHVTPFIAPELAARMDHEAGRPAAARDPRAGRTRSASARSACRRSSAARRSIPKTEVQTFAMISEEISRGDCRLVRQARADLESVRAAAQRRAAPPPGEMVPAHRRRSELPARALPDRAARRLRPLAAVRRARSDDAHARRDERRQVGDQRPQAVHQQRLRREALRRVCHDEAGRGHDQGHVELPRAARYAGTLASRAATRRWAGAS